MKIWMIMSDGEGCPVLYRFYKDKPTLEQLSSFIEETDYQEHEYSHNEKKSLEEILEEGGFKPNSEYGCFLSITEERCE